MSAEGGSSNLSCCTLVPMSSIITACIAQKFVLRRRNTSLHGKKAHVQKLARELMLNLLPGDKKYSGYLISYGNQPELIADTSSDSEKMVAKMNRIKPAGGAALFDAIAKLDPVGDDVPDGLQPYR